VIHPLTEEKEFWEVVNLYQGKIEELTFDLTAPNVLNLKNNLNEDLREAKKEFAMTATTISIKNNLGGLVIPKNNPFINQGLEYTKKGGGETRLRIKGRKKVYSSNDNKNIKTKDMDFDADLSNASEEVQKHFFETLFQWLES
jgi:hypothetical protein